MGVVELDMVYEIVRERVRQHKNVCMGIGYEPLPSREPERIKLHHPITMLPNIMKNWQGGISSAQIRMAIKLQKISYPMTIWVNHSGTREL